MLNLIRKSGTFDKKHIIDILMIVTKKLETIAKGLKKKSLKFSILTGE